MHPLLIFFVKLCLGKTEVLGSKLNGKVTAFLFTAVEIFCKVLRGKTYMLIHRNLLDAIVGTFLLVLSRSGFFFS